MRMSIFRIECQFYLILSHLLGGWCWMLQSQKGVTLAYTDSILLLSRLKVTLLGVLNLNLAIYVSRGPCWKKRVRSTGPSYAKFKVCWQGSLVFLKKRSFLLGPHFAAIYLPATVSKLQGKLSNLSQSAPKMVVPMATDQLWLRVLESSIPNIWPAMAWRQGILEPPPISSRAWIGTELFLAWREAIPAARSDSTGTIASQNCWRVMSEVRSSSPIRYSKLRWCSELADRTVLSFWTASVSLTKALGLLQMSLPVCLRKSQTQKWVRCWSIFLQPVQGRCQLSRRRPSNWVNCTRLRLKEEQPRFRNRTCLIYCSIFSYLSLVKEQWEARAAHQSTSLTDFPKDISAACLREWRAAWERWVGTEMQAKERCRLWMSIMLLILLRRLTRTYSEETWMGPSCCCTVNRISSLRQYLTWQ